jgi:hypothetical protein
MRASGDWPPGGVLAAHSVEQSAAMSQRRYRMENATIRQLVSGALLALFSSPLAAELKPGDNAPAFELLLVVLC